MDLEEARALAFSLIKLYGLDNGWTFRYDRAVRRFGACRLKQKEISLSSKLTALNSKSEIEETIRHEIAHALTPGHGHDKTWKEKATEIGCFDVNRAVRSSSFISWVNPYYKGICSICGLTYTAYRKSRLYCSRCWLLGTTSKILWMEYEERAAFKNSASIAARDSLIEKNDNNNKSKQKET